MLKLRQDVAYACRTFAKAPGFAAIAIVVLGVGIGANTAIFTIVNELLLRPLSGRAGELVGLYSHDRTRPGSYRGFSYPNYVDIRDRSDAFDSVLAHTFSMVGTPAGDDTRRTFAAVISSNYFATLGVTLAAGRPFSAEEERPGADIPVVIATYARWKQERLDPSFLGRTIRVNARDYTVVGVTPEGFTGTMALVSADLYLPLGVFDTVVNDRFKKGDTGIGDRANTAFILAGRIKPGLSEPAVAARLDALSRQLEAAYPAENKDQALTVSPLPRMATSTSPQDNSGLAALTALLMGLSGVVLIIACLNLANMLLARGAARRKELAVRLALGASRLRIVRQLLTESVLLAIAGAALGLLLSFAVTRALGASLTAALPLNVAFSTTPDLAVLVATTAFAALSAIAFGLGPAIRLSRRDLVVDLKERGTDGASTGRRFGARNLMVIGQVALSLALLTGAGIFARTAITAAAGNPGHSYDRIMLASLDAGLAGMDEPQGRRVYAAVLDRIRSRGNIGAAAMASTMSFGDIQEGGQFERPGGRESVRARTYRVITADYFRTLGLKMVRGREFTRAEEESASAPAVAIVDEAFARRMFPDDDPIGQVIRTAGAPGDAEPPGQSLLIVGVAPPLREELLDVAPATHVYVPFGRHYNAGMFVLARTAAPLAGAEVKAADDLRTAIRSADARLPLLALSTLQAFHDRGLELWALRIGAALFSGLGILAMLLAALGVYGVKSYVVAQRTREIGIRMALGASARDVLGLILRDGAFLAGTGVAIGLPLAVLVSILFSKVFIGIGGFDAWVITVATLVLALAAGAAGAVPARRATRVQPLRALQGE